MRDLLLVGAGGFVGSVCRHLATSWVQHGRRLPAAAPPLARILYGEPLP